MGQEDKQGNILIYIGVCIIVLTFGYFFSITFFNVPVGNQRYSDLILGYISGIVSAIVGYYWGGSDHKPPPGINIPSDNKTSTETTTTITSVPKDDTSVETTTVELDEEDMTPPVKG